MNIPDILIADDENEARDMIRKLLNDSIRCNIHEAENGDEALKILKKEKCDILILDIRMPKKSGMHVLDEMMAAGKNVDTLVITAWDSALVAEECAKRNVECMPKPVMFDELYAKITKLLKKRGQFIPVDTGEDE
ncbi:MAG: response regulator [Candidatus Omnitrophota bacterium]